MNSTVTAGPRARSRLTLIVAGIFVLLGTSVVTAPAQAGYYGASYDPCSYRCGYPAYRYGHAVFDFIAAEWGKDAVREFRPYFDEAPVYGHGPSMEDFMKLTPLSVGSPISLSTL